MTSVFLLLLPIWTALVSAGVDDMWDGLNSKFNLFIFLIKTKKKHIKAAFFQGNFVNFNFNSTLVPTVN